MGTPTKAQRIEMLHQMKRIRAYEEGIAHRYSQGKMRCPTHLSIGQEAVPAALSQILSHQDLAISTHRAHAHYLGKGGSGPKMLAEIYGKATGCAHGRGGSMHLIDLSVGFKGSTAIVGNTIPVGVGVGLALKLQQDKKREKNISVVFLGDAAVEEGAFYESVNFAICRKLPVLFVCENNYYSVYSPLSVRQPDGRRIFEMVRAMGIRATEANGNDVEESFSVLKSEVGQMRSDSLPCFVELSTYRWREHCGPNFDNDLGYRTVKEFEEWKLQDPIAHQEHRLLKAGLLDAAAIEQMNLKVDDEVRAAFDFAESSPFPDESSALAYAYAPLGHAANGAAR